MAPEGRGIHVVETKVYLGKMDGRRTVWEDENGQSERREKLQDIIESTDVLTFLW